MAKQKTNWDNLVDNVSQSDWYTSILENKVLFAVGTVVMLILAVVLYGMIGGDNEAPDFTLKDTDGVTFSLSDYQKEGKIVILDFMFSTCEPCKKLVENALEPYSKKMDNDKVMKFNFRLSIRDPSSPVHQTYPPRLDSHFSRVLHSAH